MAPNKLTGKTKALAWKADVIDIKAILKKGRPCGGPEVIIDPGRLPRPIVDALNRYVQRVVDARKTDK
jgi:hypothetical protein